MEKANKEAEEQKHMMAAELEALQNQAQRKAAEYAKHKQLELDNQRQLAAFAEKQAAWEAAEQQRKATKLQTAALLQRLDAGLLNDGGDVDMEKVVVEIEQQRQKQERKHHQHHQPYF